MSETFRKAFTESGTFSIREISHYRELEPLDAVVKVDAALLTQLELSTDAKIQGLGSAACGVITHIGEEVSSFSVGDKVVFNANMPCYVCNDCQRGYSSNCQRTSVHHEAGGCIAEYMFINNAEANLAKQPESVSDELACYAPHLLAKSMHAIDKACLPVGSIVGVSGLGPYGLMAIACANLSCAGYIFAMVNEDTHELRYAKEFGADSSIQNASERYEAIMDYTNGVGLDASIDCSGTAEGLKECINLTRIGGSIIRTEHPKEADGELLELMLAAQSKDINIQNVNCPTGSENYSRMLRLIEKLRIDPSMLTTHRCDFEQLEEYLPTLNSNSEEHVETVLVEF